MLVLMMSMVVRSSHAFDALANRRKAQRPKNGVSVSLCLLSQLMSSWYIALWFFYTNVVRVRIRLGLEVDGEIASKCQSLILKWKSGKIINDWRQALAVESHFSFPKKEYICLEIAQKKTFGKPGCPGLKSLSPARPPQSNVVLQRPSF